MHILSHGSDTYTSDQRYKAGYDEISDTWALMMTQAKTSDSGVYECQLSSLPVISYPVHLHVVDVHVDILGDEDLFVQTDSFLTLTCIVTNLPRKEISVVWSHDGWILSPSTYVAINTALDDFKSLKSELRISRIYSYSAGVYKCEYTGSKQDLLHLHVLNGERTQKRQTSCANKSVNNSCLVHITLFVFVINKILRGIIEQKCSANF